MTTTAPSRSGDLDASRGAAMVFVCLSHFTAAFFPDAGMSGPQRWLRIVALIASPTFVVLSGLLLGWRFRIAPERFPRFRARLRDRAVFLLTIGHLAIVASQLRRMSLPGEQPVFVVLTDVIAIAILIGPLVVARIAVRYRLVVAALLYAVSWALILAWTPHGELARAAKAVFLGLRPSEGDIGGYCVPVLPWLAVYIAATGIGHMLAGRTDQKGLLDCPTLWRAGAAAVVIAVVQRLLVLSVAGSDSGEHLQMLTTTWQKVPPGPVYLLANGGAGLIMIAIIAQLRRTIAGAAATGWLELVGRHSAIVFIAQFYVYSILVPVVAPTLGVPWPPVFASTVGLLVLFAWTWERFGLERLLTVQPLLQPLPTRSMRAVIAVGLAAIVLLLGARLERLVPVRRHAYQPAVAGPGMGSRHL